MKSSIQNRIQEILNYYKLSQSEFAEILQIQRSTLSHIFSGRNKPSLDLVEKIKTKYENISTDWLIFGKGNMFITSEEETTLPLYSIDENSTENSIQEKITYSEHNIEKNIIHNSQVALQKIIFFDTQGEFEIFTPKK